MNNQVNFGKPTEKQKNEYFQLFGQAMPADIDTANKAGNVIGEERRRRSEAANIDFAKWCGQNWEKIEAILGDITAEEAKRAYITFGKIAKDKRKVIFNYNNQ